MNNDELFIESYNLPEQLSEEEFYKLMQEAQYGSIEARNEIIIHNIKLVINRVKNKFQYVNYDRKDLVSVGIFGLINAINTYDISKGIKFSTYAYKCIDIEIIKFLKKNNNVDSLEKVVFRKEAGREITLKDQLMDNRDFVKENETAETYKIIREIVENLPEKPQKIIMLYFGFYNDKIYTQKEIADMMHLSRTYVSKLIIKTVNQISKILESKGVIELHSKQSNSRKRKQQKFIIYL